MLNNPFTDEEQLVICDAFLNDIMKDDELLDKVADRLDISDHFLLGLESKLNEFLN